MNILAVDTSTKKANVCLEFNNKITNKCIDNEITHSEKLLPLIDEVLNSSNCNLKNIDYLACSAGPGSFTGIRIGIATIKAFAKVLNVPIFNISSLDILAYTETASDYVISIMDAKNSRIYYCVYKIEKRNLDGKSVAYLEKICDHSNDVIDIALEEISNFLCNEHKKEDITINIVGDCIDNYSELFKNKLADITSNINTYTATLSSDTLVTMLKNYIDLGIDDKYKQSYLTADAIYVRPSQAERAKKNEL